MQKVLIPGCALIGITPILKNIYTWRANGIYVCLIESHDGVTGEFRANRTIKELTESWIGFNVAGYH